MLANETHLLCDGSHSELFHVCPKLKRPNRRNTHLMMMGKKQSLVDLDLVTQDRAMALTFPCFSFIIINSAKYSHTSRMYKMCG